MSDDPILAALARIETRLTGLEAGQTKLEAGQTKLEAGQTRLRVDLMGRMDKLEDKMTAIRDDIGVNFGTADAVRRVNDNTREELRALNDTVAAMYRVVRKQEARVDRLEGRTSDPSGSQGK